MPPKSLANLADNPTPAYLTTQEFRSRMAWLSQSVVLRQPSAFRDKVLSQGGALQNHPKQRAAEVAMEKLLEGKTRLFPASAGHAVNFRAEYRSIRDLVQCADHLMQSCVASAHAALVRAESMPPLTYFVEVEFDENFEGVTRHQVASPAYLAWALAVMARPHRDQQAIRHFCEVENDWWWKTEGKERYPLASAIELEVDELQSWRTLAGTDLMELLGAMSPEAAALIEQREAPHNGHWQWRQPWGVHSVPWPFAGTLGGDEDVPALIQEAERWNSLGLALSWIPFDCFIDSADPTAESDAIYQLAIEAWAECIECGQTLSLLSGILRACTFTSGTDRLCEVCHRHVGHGQRSRCRLHASRAAGRSQSTQLVNVAEKYVSRLQDLRRQLSGQSVMSNAAMHLSACWALHPVRLDPDGGQRHPLMQGKWPVMPASEAAQYLSVGILRMVSRLEPVAGLALFERLQRLALYLKERALKATSTLEAGPDLGSHCKSRQEPKAARDALWLLTPPGFFSLWHGGVPFADAPDGLAIGIDPDHPLVAKSLPISRRSGRSLRRNADMKRAKVFSFETAVRDLLRQRAWLDVGGGRIDEAVLNGRPIAHEKTTQRINVEQAFVLQKQGLPLRKIGEVFGVSAPAVLKALKKRLAVETTSSNDRGTA